VVSLALLALAAAMLNPLCLKLFPVALVVLVVNTVLAPAFLPVARWCLRLPRPV